MSQGAIFLSKTETQLTFEHGAKRRRSKSPEQGGEDLNGGDPAKLGRRPFSHRWWLEPIASQPAEIQLKSL